MELLAKYREEIAKELQIDQMNIKQVQLRLPSRKHFWLGRLMDARIKLNHLQSDKKRMKIELVAQVKKDSPVTLTTSAAEVAVENSAKIQQHNEKIREVEFIVEYLERVEKIMSSMHWEIRNIIQILELESGK